jgi:hypothetical protein
MKLVEAVKRVHHTMPERLQSAEVIRFADLEELGSVNAVRVRRGAGRGACAPGSLP